MPTYFYKCQQCQHEFEKFLSMSQNAEPESDPCPECKETSVKQTIGKTQLVLDNARMMGGFHLPEDWRYFLKRMQKANPSGYIRDR